MSTLAIFGYGYCARAVAHAVLGSGAAQGFSVIGTSRSVAAGANPGKARPGKASPENVALVPFDAAAQAIAAASHILVCIPPDQAGDPVLGRYAAEIASAPNLRWIGYLSSTVVYGDRDGGWVDEDTPPAPSQPRGQRRLDAESAWSRFADRRAVDIFRLAGIYGPERSAFDDLRHGTARRTIKPGHLFSRIHRDDIARAVAAAIHQPRQSGSRVLNLADDVPAESAVAAGDRVRRRVSGYEPDGQKLLGRKPPGSRRENPTGARFALVIPELPRRPRRHLARGERRPSAVTPRGRPAATAGDLRP
jgi:nucleoside-diphosphate-sugar epimerase